MIFYATQTNDSTLRVGKGGTLLTQGTYVNVYNVKNMAPGTSPVLLYYGSRSYPPTVPIRATMKTEYALSASAFGITIKSAPVIKIEHNEGGTVSNANPSGVTYQQDATYEITSEIGYRIKQITVDENIVEITDPTHMEYTFPKVESDHVLSVEFERIIASIKYDANAPDAVGEMMPTEVESYTTVPVSDNVYEYRGRRFTGWNTSPDGTGTTYKPGEEIYVEEQDVALYAQWEDIPHTVTWTDSLTGEIFHVETVLDTFPAPIPPFPEHEGYKAVLPFTDEELSSITEDKNYSVSYELIPYKIGVEFISKDTGKPIAPAQTYTQPFKSTLSIDAYIKEIYALEPDMISVMDANTGEAILPEDVFEMTLDDFGRVSEMTCCSTPARNLTVRLLYDCSIKMPETGSPGMAVLMALGMITVGAYITCRASCYRRKR